MCLHFLDHSSHVLSRLCETALNTHPICSTTVPTTDHPFVPFNHHHRHLRRLVMFIILLIIDNLCSIRHLLLHLVVNRFLLLPFLLLFPRLARIHPNITIINAVEYHSNRDRHVLLLSSIEHRWRLICINGPRLHFSPISFSKPEDIFLQEEKKPFSRSSRVIDAHAASYSDNPVHHYHHHHPPSASIDLIAYAWMSPGHDIFSLPAAFSIHFGVSVPISSSSNFSLSL